MLHCFWRIFWYKKRQQLQSKIDKMSDRMATRHAICALSAAGRSNNDIVRTLKVAKTTVIQTLKKRRIKSAPTKSLRRVAKEASLKPGVVWKLVRDGGWRSLRRKKVPLISSAGRKKRAARAAGLINALKEGGYPGRILFRRRPRVQPAERPIYQVLRLGRRRRRRRRRRSGR